MLYRFAVDVLWKLQIDLCGQREPQNVEVEDFYPLVLL